MMGYEAVISAVTAAEYDTLMAGADSADHLLRGAAHRTVAVADEWAALTMLLTGHLLSPDDPVDEVLVGSKPLGTGARAVPPSHVTRIARELAKLDGEMLASRLGDIIGTLEDQIESNWGLEPLSSRDVLLDLASQVKRLYSDAAEQGEAVVVQSAMFAGARSADRARRKQKQQPQSGSKPRRNLGAASASKQHS